MDLSKAQENALDKIGPGGTVAWYDIHPATRKKLLKLRLIRRLVMTISVDRLELTDAGREALSEAKGE